MSSEDAHEEGEGVVGGEAESTAEYKPVVKLEQVQVTTGEEDDTELYKQRAALYRFDSTSNEWKERGKGDVKLLQNKKTQIIRILLRQDKTLKVCCNHNVDPSMALRVNGGSDRSWVWRCRDFADDTKPEEQTFAIRFKDTEIAGQFQTAYDKARESNKSKLGQSTSTSASSSTSTSSSSSSSESSTTAATTTTTTTTTTAASDSAPAPASTETKQ